MNKKTKKNLNIKERWAVFIAGTLITAILISVSVNVWHTFAASTPSDAGFSDIDASPYKDAISFVQSKGIVEGYSDGTFRPDIEINRAEFTKIMVGSTYQEEIETYQATPCFPDVNAADWFAKYVCLAKDHGVIGGYPDGTFRPSQNINAAESLKITMLAMFGEEIEDVSGPWYQKYLDFANRYSFKPIAWDDVSKKITRGEMAEFIYKIVTGIPEKMLEPCADIIKQQAKSCSKYENWSLIVNLSLADANEEIFSIDGYDQGAGNKCASEMAEEKYPRDVKSTLYFTQIAGSGTQKQVACEVLCNAWSCPNLDLVLPTPSESHEGETKTEIETETEITLSSRNCVVGETFSDGSVSHDIQVSGTASGPVGSRLFMDASCGSEEATSCGAWSVDYDNACKRGGGDPEMAQWTFQSSSCTAGSVGLVYVSGGRSGEAPKSVSYDEDC